MGGGKKKQTVGYRYFMSLHLIMCYGPIDEILKMRIGDRNMYRSINDGGNDENITSTGNYVVSGKRQLFGGEDREGGVGAVGTVTIPGPLIPSKLEGDGIFNRFTRAASTTTFNSHGGRFRAMFGNSGQNPDTHLQNFLGNDIPAYRGVAGIVFKGFYFGNNPYIKDMKFNITRYPDVIPGESGNRIISEDANAAQIIFECLTDRDWGMGYSQSDIDVPSFQAVSQQLAAEDFGISLIWGESQPIEEFIRQVLSHVNGSLFLSRTTGLFVLKLIRDDFVFANLPIYNEQNIVAMKSFSRRAWGETVNEVTVVITDNEGDPVPLTVQDLANIQIQGGEIINQKVEYPGIRRKSLANRVAQRDLATQSSPLARVKFQVNRQAWDASVGDPFRLQWANYGLADVVFRIASINYGKLQQSVIEIDAIEDAFSLDDSSYVEPQPTGWVEPLDPPADVANFVVYESNYWDLVQNLGESQAAAFIFDPVTGTPDDGFYFVAARKPTTNHYHFNLLDRPNGSTQEYVIADSGQSDFAPSGTLEFDMETGFETEFTYLNGIDIDVLPLAELILIEDEYCQVIEIDQANSRLVITRGMLDTLPVAHAAGTYWFAVQNFAIDSEEQYTDGETVEFKILTTAGLGQLALDDATAHTFTFDGRAGKPWAPGNLQIEALPAFQPQGMTGGTPLDFTWAHRDRTQQTGAFVYQDDPSIGPETGVEYTLRLYDETDTLQVTVTGITGTSYTWTTEQADSGLSGDQYNSAVRVELEAVQTLTGAVSHQAHNYLFRRADYGHSYGYFYGGFS